MEIWRYNYGPTRSDELYHWGIKGMKWGVRRFQNPDGSLTPAGKIRYIGAGRRDRKYDMTADVRNRIRSSKGNTEKAISSVKKDAKEVEKYYDKQFDAFEKIQKVRNTAGLIAGMGASLAITGGASTILEAALGVASAVGTYGAYSLASVASSKTAVNGRKYVYDNINRYTEQTVDDIKSRIVR